MKKFLEIIGIDQDQKLTLQERRKIFANKAMSENCWLVNVIIQFLQYQKDRVNSKEITGLTLRNYVKALKLFCEMNDLYVPWNIQIVVYGYTDSSVRQLYKEKKLWSEIKTNPRHSHLIKELDSGEITTNRAIQIIWEAEHEIVDPKKSITNDS